jgi:hypothetical protein
MLVTSPLGDARDSVLEMLQARMPAHGFEASIELILANDVGAPRDKMILEDTLMKLVKDIRSDTREYIRVRQMLPERLVHSSKTVSFEL